jgi:hypothetical protein
MVEAGVIAIDAGVAIETVADGIAPHPTLSEAIKGAALVALGRAIDVPNHQRTPRSRDEHKLSHLVSPSLDPIPSSAEENFCPKHLPATPAAPGRCLMRDSPMPRRDRRAPRAWRRRHRSRSPRAHRARRQGQRHPAQGTSRGWRGGWEPGPDPQSRDYASFADFADPDGNTWTVQEIGYRA